MTCLAPRGRMAKNTSRILWNSSAPPARPTRHAAVPPLHDAVLLARCCWRGRRERKPGDGQLTRGALACSDEESSASSDSDAEEVDAGSHGGQAPRDVEVRAHEEEKKKTQEDRVMCVARAARQREIPARGSGCVRRRRFVARLVDPFPPRSLYGLFFFTADHRAKPFGNNKYWEVRCYRQIYFRRCVMPM
mgnify:FL=1